MLCTKATWAEAMSICALPVALFAETKISKLDIFKEKQKFVMARNLLIQDHEKKRQPWKD
jgi:hypothetical protein